MCHISLSKAHTSTLYISFVYSLQKLKQKALHGVTCITCNSLQGENHTSEKHQYIYFNEFVVLEGIENTDLVMFDQHSRNLNALICNISVQELKTICVCFT